MAERINLGGEYETEDGEMRQKYWVDLSSSLMNRLNALAISRDETPREVLAQAIEGEIDLDENDE